MTDSLREIPDPPAGVKYALTVPQSVLFTDLCLRGNTEQVYRDTLGLRYMPRYIAYDNGAMSWDYSLDEPFVQLLGMPGDGAASVITRFLGLMGQTSRSLVRVAEALGPAAVRPRDGADEYVLADLQTCWDAYERHMTSLFTFWNVETLLTHEIQNSLSRCGREAEATSWIADVAAPTEKNYFALEQQSRARLAQRFDTARSDDAEATRGELTGAATEHARLYGFLFAPYNLSLPPGPDVFVEQIESPEPTEPASEDPQAEAASPSGSGGIAPATDLPADVRLLGHLAGRLAFWKSERLDAFALADFRLQELYRQAATILGLDELELFTMTRAEVENSLRADGPVTSSDVRKQRSAGFALVLHDGRIEFCRPSKTENGDRAGMAAAESGAVLTGMSGSAGSVEGPVRVAVGDRVPELKSGEILVAAMTRVEMGALLDRAAAFITDEGGIICHAAILAREKGKPCVIGTDCATAVLRDGMRVRVDGDAGVVHVL